jgi:hypothetical protein
MADKKEAALATGRRGLSRATVAGMDRTAVACHGGLGQEEHPGHRYAP